jgi:hypothetical protein
VLDECDVHNVRCATGGAQQQRKRFEYEQQGVDADDNLQQKNKIKIRFLTYINCVSYYFFCGARELFNKFRRIE